MTDTANHLTTPASDLVDRLRGAAKGADDLAIEDLEALLNEAANALEGLRSLVERREKS